MKTIRERAKEYATRDKSSEFNLLEGIDVYKNIYTEEFFAYEKGASDQKAIDIEKAKTAFGKACGWLSTYLWYNEVFEKFMKIMEEEL